MNPPHETTTHEQASTPAPVLDPSSGGGLGTVDGRILPLEATSVEAHAAGGLARVVLKQRFRNPGVEPLAVRYAVALPADAAVGAYVFELEALGLGFQIATRLTSWVATSPEALVDPTEPIRRVRMPQSLAYGLSVEGLGLRAGTGAVGKPQVKRLYAISMEPRVLARRRVYLRERIALDSRNFYEPDPDDFSQVLQGRIVSRKHEELVIEFDEVMNRLQPWRSGKGSS